MEVRDFVLEGNEFIGIKAGQDYYKTISKELTPGVNRLIFPEDAEVTASWIRGFQGFRDDNLYVSFHSNNPELDDFLTKWSNYLECVHGDKEAVDNAPKKKKK